MKFLNSNVVLKIFDDEKRLGVFTQSSKRLAALVGIKKRFAALLLLGLLAPCFSYCEIIPDSSAPANHRASVSQTPNAPATQIDIASPNDKGVSINEYSKFNTPKEGTIFNNSQSGTISKTAGYIPPNPRLNRGEAKLIINQVNSSLPSNLQGNIEIAGKKADLIIANPNGINVNGATIINSKSSALSTAKINYEEGRIKTFDVDKNGRINISDKGLNADGDYLNVISNSLKLEGKIYANEINVVVGDNEVKLKDSKEGSKGDNLQIVSKNLSSSPSVAIDSSALGGMYAGKINIISTKDGAGVNNKGAILANDSLRLNSKGELINEARIGSNGEVQIYSKAVHNRKGAKISAPSLNVQTMALNNGGEIEAGTLKIKTNRLDNIKGTISSSSALKIEAKSLINKDRAVIGTANSEISKELGLDKKGNLNAAGKISPQKSELSVISADHISNISGAILSNESYLDIKDSLLNDNGIISLRSLDAEIADFSNTAGSSFEVRQGLRLRGKNLRNQGSIISLGDISLSYDLINNSKGSIISGESLSLNAKSLDNEEGLINSKKNLSLSLGSLIHMGKLNSGGDLYLGLKDDLIYKGGIYASGNVYLDLKGNFTASQKLISNKDLIVSANNIKNESILAALQNLSLKANGELLNLGSLIAKQKLALSSNSIVNKSALIYAAQGLALEAKSVTNKDGANILSSEDIFINSSALRNENLSNVISKANLHIFNKEDKEAKASTIDNLSSLIYAGAKLNINAKKLNNRSVNELVKGVQSTGHNIDFTCNGDGWGCSGVTIPLRANAQQIRDEILKERPNISEAELKEELLNRLSLRDMNLYVLNLYKNTLLPGEDTKLYDAITLSLGNNLFSISRSKPHKKERLRQINYSINKEYITEDSLSKFASSNIISKDDANLNVDELNNDKSIIYAYNDLLLNVKSLNNRSLSLNHSITSRAEYRWKHKRHSDKGGYSDQKNIYYSQPAIASIIGAKKDIKGYGGDIKNLNPAHELGSSTAPTLIDEAYSKIDYSAIAQKLKNDNAVSLDKNKFASAQDGAVDMQEILRPGYINNLFSPISDKFYNTFYVYSELIPDFSYMHNKLSLAYDKKGAALSSLKKESKDALLGGTSPSVIYAGGGISLNANGELKNEGLIYAGSSINLSAENISNSNSASIIARGALNIAANKDIINASSLMQGSSVSLQAGRDIIHKTPSKELVINKPYGTQSSTYLSATAAIRSTDGDTILRAGRDISISGADISSAKSLILNAANDIIINSAQEKIAYAFSGKGTYYKADITENKRSSLEAKDNILMGANNIRISGADINAHSGDALLKAKEAISLSYDLNSYYYESEFKEKGFASKKSTTTKALNQSVVPTSIRAKNIMLSSQEADINIAGSTLKAKEAIDMQAGNNINISPASYSFLSYKNSSKSSLGGLKASMDMHSLYKRNLQSSSLSSETGDINLRAKNDLNLISADISSGRNLSLSAGNSINILAAKEYKEELSVHKRRRFNPISVLNYPVAIAASVGAMDNIALEAGIEKIGGGSLTEVYRSDYNNKQIKEGISKLSDIKAAGDISLNSPTAFITSNMKAGGDINIAAKNLTISAAANEYSEHNVAKSASASITKAKDSLNQMKPKSLDEFKKDTSLKAKIASASYDKSNANSYGTKTVSSNMEAKNITLRGDNSLSVIGSSLKAEEDLNLISKDGNINIINSTDTASSSSSSKHLEASLSLTVQNEYAQIAPAAIALAEAVKQLNKTKKQYKEYKQQKNALQDKLVELKNRYKAKEVGIDYSDIEDLQNIIEDVKDEEKYYLSNIALATANVASKTAALISQKSAASASAYTWGFSVGASAELSGTASKDSSKSTGSVASNLSGKNIKILTDSNKDTAINIKGSNLYASNDIYLNTHNLFIEASQDSYEAKQSSKTISGRVSATMYGGGGLGAGLDYSRSNMKEESLSHNNAKVYAGHNIYALASNDALIKGANLRADNALALKVGHDLGLHSLRDSYNYDSKSSSIAAGIGISGSKTNSGSSNPYAVSNNIVSYSNSKLSSINANYSRSKSSTTVKQTVLSSITAKELDIEVGSNTDLKGSLIAAGYYDENGNFIDNGKLRLKTNTLTFSNLSNTRYDKSNSLSIGTNYAFKDPQQEGGSKHRGNQASDNKNAEAKESSRLKQDDLSAEHIKNTIKSIKEKVAKEDSKNFSSSSVSLSRSHSVRLNKTLATVGCGNLIINNEAGSDELSRLNRDTAKIQKDIVNSNLYSSAKADIDHRFFSQDGRDQIKKELLLLTDSLSNHMPSENSNNAFERTIAKGLNFLGTYSLGLIPSEENNGGLLANIGAIAVGDPKFKILGNPESKRAFVNGILTDEKAALDQAKGAFESDNVKVYSNPTRGGIPDFVESIWDIFGWRSGLSRQIEYEMSKNPDDINILLSQANPLAKRYSKNNKNTINIGTPLGMELGKHTINDPRDPVNDLRNIFKSDFWSAIENDRNPFYDHHVGTYTDKTVKSIKKYKTQYAIL